MKAIAFFKKKERLLNSLPSYPSGLYMTSIAL